MKFPAITLYNEDHEPVETYAAICVPWGVVKRVIGLLGEIGTGAMDDRTQAAASGLLVEAFGGQFSRAEIKAGAEWLEMVTALAEVAGLFDRSLGVMPGEIDRVLVGMGHKLNEIDQIEVTTLMEWLRNSIVPGKSEEKAPDHQSSNRRQPGQVYADKVSWL